MTIAILILVHFIYVWRLFEGLATEGEVRGILLGVLLSLLCYQEDTTWGIVTIAYTSVISIIAIIQRVLS